MQEPKQQIRQNENLDMNGRRTHHKRTATTYPQEHPRLQKLLRPTHNVNTETLRDNEHKPSADPCPPDKRNTKGSYQSLKRTMDNTKVERRGTEAWMEWLHRIAQDQS